MTELSPPSPWARQRFGAAAQPLRAAIPLALQEAQRRALAAHLAGELESRDAYGGPLAVMQHEELARHTMGIDGVRTVKPPSHSRYRLVVVGDVVLYPWRYASDARDFERAQLRRPVSELRKDLLALTEEPPPPPEWTLDQAELTEDERMAEYEDEKALRRDLVEAGRTVLIAYASNPESGLLRVVWGDAELVDDERGTLRWTHPEDLPLPAQRKTSGKLGEGLRQPRPQPAGHVPAARTGGARFDDAPLVEPQLGIKSPLVEPDPEQPTAPPSTGSSGQDT